MDRDVGLETMVIGYIAVFSVQFGTFFSFPDSIIKENLNHGSLSVEHIYLQEIIVMLYIIQLIHKSISEIMSHISFRMSIWWPSG